MVASATKNGTNLLAVASLMFANVAISINQSNVAAVYYQMSSEFNQSVVGLGILTSSFFLAYSVSEMPGGVLASKLGPKRVVMLGMVSNAITVVWCGLAPTFGYITIARFLAGLGSGLAFPSILVLIVQYFRRGSTGLGVGLIFLSSGIGVVVALFGWSVLGAAVGWRPSLIVGGLISLAAVPIIFLLVPRGQMEPVTKLRIGNLRKVIFRKPLAILSLGQFGAGATASLVPSFMVFYLEAHFGLASDLSGLITGLGLGFSMFSGLLVGRFFDRAQNTKPLLLAMAVAAAFGVSVASIDSLYSAMASTVLGRFFGYGLLAIGLSTARRLGADSEYETLTVGVVDTFGLFGNFVSPIYFSLLAVLYGYSAAWFLGGLVALVLITPRLLVKNEIFVRK